MANQVIDKSLTTHGDKNIPPGMLSSPQIHYCVDRYNIIEGFDPSCLDSATYHMRLGDKVLTWDHGKKIEFKLGKEEDKNKNIYTKVELKPNSLTFVTTIEKFNLPKDIIARFNLKSRLVHKALLLGTGPIVDPELKANLLIPIHNFSSQNVTLNYNEKIISVEFTKTLNPDQLITLNEKIYSFRENNSRNFDFEGYVKRIGGEKVESSVAAELGKLDLILKDYTKKLNLFSVSAIIGFAALMITLATAIWVTLPLIVDARNQLIESKNIMMTISGKNYDSSSFAPKSTVDDLRDQLVKLKEELKDVPDKQKSMLANQSKFEHENIQQDVDKNKLNSKAIEK